MLQINEWECRPSPSSSDGGKVKTQLEQLQVVHYAVGQKYDTHYDWADSGVGQSRFITVLLYLNDMESEDAGGETAFPGASFYPNMSNWDSGNVLSEESEMDTAYEVDIDGSVSNDSIVPTEGFKVHPGKGGAILFYNLLPDGNGDIKAMHSALPVLRGEKWLANFWIWDPHA